MWRSPSAMRRRISSQQSDIPVLATLAPFFSQRNQKPDQVHFGASGFFLNVDLTRSSIYSVLALVLQSLGDDLGDIF
jgi:hypothetical protein